MISLEVLNGERGGKKSFSSLPLLEAVSEKNFPDFFLLLILKVGILPIFDNYQKSAQLYFEKRMPVLCCL